MTAAQMFEQFAHAMAVRSWQIAAVACATLVALKLLNLVAPKLDLIDHAEYHRKQPFRPIPLTGGLAILCGVWIGMLVHRETEASAGDVLALLGIVASVHAFDDQSGLSARQRLVIDSVIALAFVVITGNVIATLGMVDGRYVYLGLMATPFTILIYVALTNAYNMLDGLDGLALSQFLIALFSIGFFHLAYAQQSGFAPLAFAVTVASGVILLANLGLLGSSLRCFLGDSGARFLGFFLVYVLIVEGNRIVSPIGAAYFVALPLIDMCAVIAGRIRDGAGPMMPDRRHIHHLLVDAGISSATTVVILAALSIGVIGIFLVINALSASDTVLALVLTGIAAIYWQTRRQLVRLLRRGFGARQVIGPAE
jgi:UDP-GlcNAc:undecaprenyl-phosphate GlcNAc-1-phosphate transferase